MQGCSKYIFRTLFLLRGSLNPTVSSHRIILTNNCVQNYNRILISCKYYKTEHASSSPQSYKPKKVTTINDLFNYISEGKQFYLKLLINVFNTINYGVLSDQQIILLLECCGSSVSDSSREKRNKICQDVFEHVVKANKVNLEIYHTYINVCTENDFLINSNQFLKIMKCEPNQNTYKLLLKNSCEKGRVDQAFEILEIIKSKQIAADEDVFNSLVFAHTLHSGMKAGESVLQTMKIAQLPETVSAKLSILRALVIRNDLDEFQKALDKFPVKLVEEELLVILTSVGLSGNHSFLPLISQLNLKQNFSREFTHKLEQLCVHFIHANHPESAMEIYLEFIEPLAKNKYGFFLLKEMLHCDIPIDVIIKLAKQLRNGELNLYVLEDLTEITLRHNYADQAWKLLGNLTELRPHYFWPIFLNVYKDKGEIGIIETVKKIHELHVKLDSNTLENYVFPHCDLSNGSLLIKKLQTFEYTVKELLTPLLNVLLKQKNVKSAVNLCKSFNVQIDGENFLKFLSSAWNSTKDSQSVAFLLQKYLETGRPTELDLLGEFLIKTLKFCDDFKSYHKLLQLIHEKQMRITSASADALQMLYTKQNISGDPLIREAIDSLVDISLKSEENVIPHPRNMNLEELECHLLELQEKNMEVRGVLRKLIQQNCSQGNCKRVQELREQFVSLGYEESAGMKSSLMHNYVQSNQLEAAISMYKELKGQHNNFNLDHFKIIDLAALMIKNGRFDEALEVLKTNSPEKKSRGDSSIDRNCWRLLGSIKDESHQIQMFNVITSLGYCKPLNIILGPIVKLQINTGDLNKAVETYANFATKYNCTPLQLELLCAIIKTNDEILLKKGLDVTASVHGVSAAQSVLIAALAESGLEKPLTKALASTTVPVKNQVKKRCERWVKEGKLLPLQTLAKVPSRLAKDVIDVDFIYFCIMQVYGLKNDCESAISFYDKISEINDGIVDNVLKNELEKLLARCNYKVSKTENVS